MNKVWEGLIPFILVTFLWVGSAIILTKYNAPTYLWFVIIFLSMVIQWSFTHLITKLNNSKGGKK